MSLTYVTAFLDIYHVTDEEAVIGRTLADRIRHAKLLLATKIPLVIYCSRRYLTMIQELCADRVQTEICVLELEETETYRLLKPLEDRPPSKRSIEKDTFEFMVLMNAKAEFVAQVAQANPFGTNQFAWIDFSIFHVLTNVSRSQRLLEQYCEQTLEKSLVIPGCWNRGSVSKDAVHWRFCGGFFLGTLGACLQFYELHKQWLPIAFDGISWEVNYWAHIDEQVPSLITWYKADHNDTILEIPMSSFAMPWLSRLAIKTGAHPYPSLPFMQPSSSSFLEYQGQQLLNVRYVNYIQTPEGMYIINDSHQRLKTENLMMRLTGYEQMEDVCRMTTDASGLFETSDSIQGLEDLRLYEHEGQLKFIATQCQWSPSRQSRMAIGWIDLVTHQYKNISILEPPAPTNCEKNWIPIVHKGQERFIYQWHPFQIGRVEAGTLVIEQTYATSDLFTRVRGSTTFVDIEEGFLGVVHSSEEGRPRHYYHRLVLLDKEDLRPISLSAPFVFGRIGIEFCIGMAVRGPDLQFWYSQHDRDPVWIVVPREVIPLRSVERS